MKLPHSFKIGFMVAGLWAFSFVGVFAQSTANALLNTYVLPGLSQSVKWTNLSDANIGLVPASGSGTISVASPGRQFSAGFYSYSGDYSITTNSATVAFDIQSAVFQFVGMRVSGEGYDLSLADHLAYGGGPVLTYTLAGGGTGSLTATFSGSLGGPIAGSGGGFSGDYYNFTWQWDLSSVTGTMVSVSVASPVHVHQSVIGAQLTVGDTFSGSVIPEPSTYVVVAGALVLTGAVLRRRKRA